jgi:cell division protein FtsL
MIPATSQTEVCATKNMRRVPSKHRNRLAPSQKEKGAVGRLALLLLCGLVLASGFVYAGVQHFGALRLGYETQKLRSDLDKAQEEQKRLLMAREAAVSPIRLEQAARQLGMQPMMPAQIDPLRQRTEVAEAKAAPALQRTEAPNVKKVGNAPAKVVALKPQKPSSLASATSATSAKPNASIEPTSLKTQEKPKTKKASSDQKKSR